MSKNISFKTNNKIISNNSNSILYNKENYTKTNYDKHAVENFSNTITIENPIEKIRDVIPKYSNTDYSDLDNIRINNFKFLLNNLYTTFKEFFKAPDTKTDIQQLFALMLYDENDESHKDQINHILNTLKDKYILYYEYAYENNSENHVSIIYDAANKALMHILRTIEI